MAFLEGLEYQIEPEEQKGSRLNLPSFSDILGLKTENPILNWHGILGGEPRGKVDIDPEALKRLRRHHEFMSHMTGMGLQAIPFLGEIFGGMGIIKDLVPSRGKAPGQKVVGKNILRGGVPDMSKIKEAPKNIELRGISKPGDITTKQASESPMGGVDLTGKESDIDVVKAIIDPQRRLEVAQKALKLYGDEYDPLVASAIRSQKTFALRDVYNTDFFINGKKVPHLKIKVSESYNSYPGQDIKWTEPYSGERTLEHDEYFYHFSRYSPDEIIFAPKETCFYSYPDNNLGHIYRVKKKRGFVVKEYENHSETRFKLKEDESLEYLGEREYIDFDQFKESPWYFSQNPWGEEHIEEVIKSFPKPSSPPGKGGLLDDLDNLIKEADEILKNR